MGFFDAVIVIFLQRHHSKEICDRFFGHIEEAFKTCGVFGVPSLLAMIERITSNKDTGAKLRGRSVNPMATSRLKEFFGAIFHQDTTGANMAEKDYHIHVVAGFGVREEMKKLPLLQLYEEDTEGVNLWTVLGNGKWIPNEAWVSCIHAPSSARIDGWCGLIAGATMREDTTPEIFYTSRGTVANDKSSKDIYRLDQLDTSIKVIGFNGRQLYKSTAWSSDIDQLRSDSGVASLWPEDRTLCLPKNWIAMTTQDAIRLCLPTHEFVEADVRQFDRIPTISNVELKPFPVPPTVGHISGDDDPRIVDLQKGCALQEELASFAELEYTKDQSVQIHFGELLVHCCDKNDELRSMPDVIRRATRLGCDDDGKLSQRAHAATMMAPLPGYFPAGSKSGWQLFCADFKDQREKDKAEQQTAGAAEEKSGSSQDGGNDDDGEGDACSSCGGPRDDEDGTCSECREVVASGNDDSEVRNGDGDDGDDDSETGTGSGGGGGGGGSGSGGCCGSAASSSSSSSSMNDDDDDDDDAATSRPIKANEAWALFKKENMGGGSYELRAAEMNTIRSAAWEEALLKYHGEETTPPWMLKETDIAALEAMLPRKKKRKNAAAAGGGGSGGGAQGGGAAAGTSATTGAGTMATAGGGGAATATKRRTVDNGVAGECSCSNTSTCSTIRCPCKKANVRCTKKCHPTRPQKAKACVNKGAAAEAVEEENDD